ncbi:restriction endonuclease [Pilimelia terevasa]|uniref:Restriction endonuclease n=1 Tax=Pilimelia terevasa TaxID=53372 RepID=A0A8J3BMI9_9ACTN|nr:restriction endonuclease [Pilimelia terevasa]GGK29905.1 restriction endonuclease [Pilimelia terevasa]
MIVLSGPVSQVPKIDEFRPVVLAVVTDGQTWHIRDIREAVKQHAGLTDDQRAERMASGELRADNRIAWAVSSFYHAGVLQRLAKGLYRITDTGRQFAARGPEPIRERDLLGLPAWDAYQEGLRAQRAEAPKAPAAASGVQMNLEDVADAVATDASPDEVVEAAVAVNRAEAAADLLTRLRAASPEFFERTVLDLLIAMGYGGASGRARHLGKTHDGGVDGVIEQDALGLRTIYVQAKRYAEGNAVGRPELQGFVGALNGHAADRGVFLTTSTFTAQAREYGAAMRGGMVVVDGPQLANLMIKFSVGVQVRQTVDLIEVDDDYFD